jgi:hypothetical protein
LNRTAARSSLRSKSGSAEFVLFELRGSSTLKRSRRLSEKQA